MRTKILIAALAAALVMLAVFASHSPARRNNSAVVTAAARPPQLPEIAPSAPGLEIESREVEQGEDGVPRLKIKVKNRAGKQLVAWGIVVTTMHGESSTSVIADPGMYLTDERDFLRKIPLREIPTGATISLQAAYEDGEVQGISRGLTSFRKDLAKERGWKQQ